MSWGLGCEHLWELVREGITGVWSPGVRLYSYLHLLWDIHSFLRALLRAQLYMRMP